MAVLYSLSVGLQVNDPDPVRWMVMYGAAALAAAVLPAQRILILPAVFVGLAAAAWGAYLLSQVAGLLEVSDLWMKMSEKGGAVEVGREAGGLAVIALFLLPGAAFRATRR
jgi:hypothetical protein